MKEDFYLDKANQWRWRLTAGNGEIIGASTEGYKDREDCVSNFRKVTTHVWAVSPGSLALVSSLILGAFFFGLPIGSVATP